MGVTYINADSWDAVNWNNPENANDGDYVATSSTKIVADQSWRSYIYELAAAKNADRIKWKVNRNNTKISIFKLEVHEEGGAWANIYEANGPWNSIQETVFSRRKVDYWKLSFWNSSFATNYDARIYASQLGENAAYWVNDLATMVSAELKEDLALVVVAT